MAKDRLAALRAQRQQQDGAASATNGSQAADYEMQGLQTPSQISNGNGAADPVSAFHAEISSIRDGISQFDANVTRISELHSRSLNSLDESAQNENNAQLEVLASETRQLSSNLKNRIKALEETPADGQDVQIRKNRMSAFVRSKFLETLQRYQEVESQYRARYKQRVERQFKIVKPDATPEEIAAVVNDDSQGGNQIFAQALSSSTRYGESRAAYKEVQERHQDIRRIEQTLAELAQLFNDMGTLLGEQDDKINAIEGQAATVESDMEGGLKHTETAVEHARSARRKRWICFWITVVLILAIVGIVVGVVYGTRKSS